MLLFDVSGSRALEFKLSGLGFRVLAKGLTLCLR